MFHARTPDRPSFPRLTCPPRLSTSVTGAHFSHVLSPLETSLDGRVSDPRHPYILTKPSNDWTTMTQTNSQSDFAHNLVTAAAKRALSGDAEHLDTLRRAVDWAEDHGCPEAERLAGEVLQNTCEGCDEDVGSELRYCSSCATGFFREMLAEDPDEEYEAPR